MLFAVILLGLSITCVLRLWNTSDLKCQISCSYEDAKHEKKKPNSKSDSALSFALPCTRHPKKEILINKCVERLHDPEIHWKRTRAEVECNWKWNGKNHKPRISDGWIGRKSESNWESIKLFLMWTNPSPFEYKSNSSSRFFPLSWYLDVGFSFLTHRFHECTHTVDVGHGPRTHRVCDEWII